MPSHRVEAIANEFLKRARAEGRPLTNMQLQKLPYIAHGWALALIDSPLVAGAPRAYPYGPVYTRLYDALKRYGSGQVTDFIRSGEDFREPHSPAGEIIEDMLTPQETKLIDTVWDKYKHFHAYDLSQMTHQPESPWTITTNTKAPFSPIEDPIIKQHFKDLVSKRRKAL